MTADGAAFAESTPEVDFWLSGQFRMRQQGEIRNLGSTLQHEILAMLVLRANSAVPVADIAGKIWPSPGAHSGEEAVRPYISRIRKMLVGLDCRLTTLPRRYILEIDPRRVDVLRFNKLVEQAGTGEREQRRACLEQALELCPTDALLQGFTRSWVRAAREEHRVRWRDAAVVRNGFWLEDGEFLRLLTVMRRDRMHKILDQRLIVNYLDALRGNGQVAEAIEYYDAVVARLKSAGRPIDRPLRLAGQRLARPDPVSDPPRPHHAPDMLPPRTVQLAGRDDTIREIERHAADRQTVRVVGIFGPSGIGKTSLATEYAHQHKHEYPGGVLFAQVGFGTEPIRADVDTVLESFLRALGLPADQIPADHQTKVDRYRDLTRGRAMLVVLDHVGSVTEVDALLPTGPGSLALVTSPLPLVDLAARHMAPPIVLAPIRPDASIALLSQLAGGRPDWSEQAAAEIAEGCAYHPLALSLAGAYLAMRPEEPLADAVAALTEPGDRRRELGQWAESDAAVTDVLRWAYRALDEPAARVFRLFGLSPCPTLDLAALAHLVDRPQEQVRPLAATLVAAQLIREAGPERYRMLDIVAEYARDLAVLFDPREVAAALDRLYAHHQAAARAAAHALWPTEVPTGPDGYGIADSAAARTWLDDHRDDLVIAVSHPATASWPEHVVDLANSLFRYLDHGGYLSQAVALHEAAVDAARRLGDASALARMVGRLGAVLVRRDADRAVALLTQARQLCASVADRRGEAVALGNLGRLAYRREHYDEALALHNEALRLFQDCGDALGQVRTQTNLALVYKKLGQPDDALRVLTEARELLSDLDAPDALARVNGTIAGVLREQGRLDEAERYYEGTIDDFRRLGDRIGEATSLTRLGRVRSDQERHAEAVRLHEKALRIFTDGGDHRAAIDALLDLGHAQRALGQHLAAVRNHHDAHDRAVAAGTETQLAAAHAALAEDYAAQETADSLAVARKHLDEALARYRALRATPAAVLALAARLAQAGDGTTPPRER